MRNPRMRWWTEVELWTSSSKYAADESTNCFLGQITVVCFVGQILLYNIFPLGQIRCVSRSPPSDLPPRPAPLPLSQSVRLSPGKSWRLWSASFFLLVWRQSKPNTDLELFFFAFFFFCREATTHRHDANGLQGPATLCTLCSWVGLERHSAHGAISQERGQLEVKGRNGWKTIKQQ